jgi:D-alanine transaminase
MSLPAYVSRNGEFITPAEASVSVFNPAIYGAYGIYESMQVHCGAIFAISEHLHRLERSAMLLEFPLPAELPAFATWCHDIVAAGQAEDATLRLLVIGADNGGASTAYLWLQLPTIFPADNYLCGVPAITFEGQRFMPQAKSLNSLVSFLARRQTQARNAHEGLLYHDGFLTEGANSNLFAVIDGTVVTPPAHQVLSGVTRDTVLRLAAAAAIPSIEAPLPLASISGWQECFITSTGRHIMPVTSVDDRPIAGGAVGPLTCRLGALFEECFTRVTARA